MYLSVFIPVWFMLEINHLTTHMKFFPLTYHYKGAQIKVAQYCSCVDCVIGDV